MQIFLLRSTLIPVPFHGPNLLDVRVTDQCQSVCGIQCHSKMHDVPTQWSRVFKSRKICVKLQLKLFCDHSVSEEFQKKMSGSFQAQKHEDGIKNFELFYSLLRHTRVCGIIKETDNTELGVVVMIDMTNRFAVIHKESWTCYIISNAVLRFKRLTRFHGIDVIKTVATYNNITNTTNFNKEKNRKTFYIVMYIESLSYALFCSYIGTLRNCYSYSCGPSFGDFSEIVSLSGFQKLSHRVISENREGSVKIKF